MNRTKNKKVTMLYIVLLSLFLVSAMQVIHYYTGVVQNQKQAEELQDEVIIWKENQGIMQEELQEDGSEDGDNSIISSSQSVEISSLIPETIDFNQLSEKNKDVVAWLYCPDTTINYPVVQAKDNDYYLHRNFDGETDRNGTLFVECENAADFTDYNTIIYGHNMKSGAMFHTLVKYKEEEFFNEHKEMYLYVPGMRYQIQLLAGSVINTDSELYSIPFTMEIRDRVLAELKLNSTFSSEVIMGGEEKIVTLSTCSYEYENARYVVVGKLVENN